MPGPYGERPIPPQNEDEAEIGDDPNAEIKANQSICLHILGSNFWRKSRVIVGEDRRGTRYVGLFLPSEQCSSFDIARAAALHLLGMVVSRPCVAPSSASSAHGRGARNPLG